FGRSYVTINISSEWLDRRNTSGISGMRICLIRIITFIFGNRIDAVIEGTSVY
ncbi:hypothetical protein Pmar_PMAR017942, partial [Perkinsus marinus ATCC 50983]